MKNTEMNPTRPLRPRVKLNRSAVSELLNVLNMTQTQLAQLCGISPGYFSLLMAGQRSPSPDVRKRIQEALGGTTSTGCSSSNPPMRKALTWRRLLPETQKGPHIWGTRGDSRFATTVSHFWREKLARPHQLLLPPFVPGGEPNRSGTAAPWRVHPGGRCLRPARQSSRCLLSSKGAVWRCARSCCLLTHAQATVRSSLGPSPSGSCFVNMAE